MSYSPSVPANHTSPLTSPEAAKYASRGLPNGILSSPMENRQPEYQSPVEHSATAQYPQTQDHRAPAQEYGLPPSSARSGSFPEYLQQQPQRSQPYTPSHGPPTGGLPQPQNPSMASSPTYPAQQSPYSPYSHPDMQYNAGAPGVYGRPDWAAHGHYAHGQHPISHYGHSGPNGPPSAGLVSPVHRPPGAGHPLSTVYSFVPIPGAQQHKRPRRRYEEIERMYKCGWEGCEKAYGTLNHLNAHVTMQSHGQKRTPEEFKEIRKEWKQKKKEEEAIRKSDDDGRHRPHSDNGRQSTEGSNMGAPQLPPINQYAHSSAQSQPGYGAPSPALVDGLQHSYPNSPYPPQTNSVYPTQQPNGNSFHPAPQ